jgi:hypothetical protein
VQYRASCSEIKGQAEAAAVEPIHGNPLWWERHWLELVR